jgi:hypothetical protein
LAFFPTDHFNYCLSSFSVFCTGLLLPPAIYTLLISHWRNLVIPIASLITHLLKIKESYPTLLLNVHIDIMNFQDTSWDWKYIITPS